MNPTVRWVLALTSVVMIAAGLGVYAFMDSFVGLVIAGVGAADLVTMRLVFGRIGRAKGTDNPYARED
jgi:hypothetical protein